MRIFITLLLALLCAGALAQNALHFDGIDDYVQTPNAGPQGSSPRTVEAWIKIDAISSVQDVIVDWGDMSTGGRFTLNIINGKPRIEVGGNGISAPSAISTGVWHHLAATYNGTQAALYIDGVPAASGSFTVPVNTTNVNGIMIGKRNDNINYFEGTVDEVRVWDIVRTQVQISSSMNKEICAPYPGLVTYYNFNQGTAGGVNTSVTVLNDLSGNNNNGDLMNFGLAGNLSNWVTGKTLTLNSSSTISPVACQSYTTPSGSNTYTVSGTYMDTLATSNGCDSVITIQLTVNTVDTSVTQNGNVLTSNAVGGTYQWIDCNNGNQNIPGQTSATYTALFNGSYAVSVTQNGCTGVSACIQVTNVGISESDDFPFSIFPNPVQDALIINIPESINEKIIQVRITDVSGTTVYNSEERNSGVIHLDMNNYRSGNYFLELTVSRSTYRSKIVKL